MNETMNILEALNQKVYPALAQGQYKCQLAGFNAVNNDKGGYLNLYFTFEDGRTITHTVFPKGITYVTENLMRQFGYKTPVSLGEILNTKQGQTIDIWVSYNEYGRNIAFHDNLTQATSAGNAPVDLKQLESMLRM